MDFGRSIETHLLMFTKYLLAKMDTRKQVDVSFSKEFDKLSHHGLLTRVDEVGAGSNFLRWVV